VYTVLHTGIMRFRNVKFLGSKVSFKYITGVLISS